MGKQAFLAQLRKGLTGLPQGDIEERVSFYNEMIDDRMEEGLSEEDAVGEIGSVDTIVSQIMADMMLTKPAKEKLQPKRTLRAWEIILIVLGFPLWFSLLVAAFAVILAFYVVVWSVIISLWVVFASFIACGIDVIIGSVGFACVGSVLTGIAMIGAGFVCIGLSVFLFYGCKMATKGTLLLTKKIPVGIKNCFVKKEAV